MPCTAVVMDYQFPEERKARRWATLKAYLAALVIWPAYVLLISLALKPLGEFVAAIESSLGRLPAVIVFLGIMGVFLVALVAGTHAIAKWPGKHLE